MQDLPAPYRVQRFADAAEQETSLAGWSQAYCQLTPGLYDGRLESLTLAGATVYRESVNVPVYQRTAPPPGETVFVQTLTQATWRMNASAVDPSAITVLTRPHEQSVTFNEQSDVLIISVSNDLLGEDEPVGDGAFTAPATEAFTFCAGWVLSLLAHFATAEGAATGELAAILPGMIVDRLQYVRAKLRTGQRFALLDRSRHVELVRKAAALVDERSGDAFAVSDLARELGVSVDALREAFVNTTGIGPGQWLKSRRLDAARRDLLRARDTGATVTEVATRWGFWHFGRFAASYAAQFGEAPSRTVRPKGPGAVNPRSGRGPGPA